MLMSLLAVPLAARYGSRLSLLVGTAVSAAAFALLAIVIAGVVWAARRNLLLFHPLFWMLGTVAGIIYLTMPRVMFATYMADQRLPIAFAFMLVACMTIDLRHRLVRRAALCVGVREGDRPSCRCAAFGPHGPEHARCALRRDRQAVHGCRRRRVV